MSVNKITLVKLRELLEAPLLGIHFYNCNFETEESAPEFNEQQLQFHIDYAWDMRSLGECNIFYSAAAVAAEAASISLFCHQLTTLFFAVCSNLMY